MKATIEIETNKDGNVIVDAYLGETYDAKQGVSLRELAIAMVEAGQRKLDEMEERRCNAA